MKCMASCRENTFRRNSAEGSEQILVLCSGEPEHHLDIDDFEPD